MTIRSLLEHVGAIEPGQRIFVNGREVDPPTWRGKLRGVLTRLRNWIYERMIRNLV